MQYGYGSNCFFGRETGVISHAWFLTSCGFFLFSFGLLGYRFCDAWLAS